LKRRNAGWWFAAPALAVIVVFFVAPVLAGFAMSLTDFDIYALADLSNLRVVYLRNYVELLQRPLFWKALANTLYFVGVGVPLSLALSLGAALLRFGWPSIFFFKAAYACALGGYYYAAVPETRPGRLSQLSLVRTFRQCRQVLAYRSDEGRRPIVYALAMPFVALVTTFLYFDARVRQELPAEGGRKVGELVPVSLESEVTEVGTLALWCNARDGGARWQLEYSVRDRG